MTPKEILEDALLRASSASIGGSWFRLEEIKKGAEIEMRIYENEKIKIRERFVSSNDDDTYLRLISQLIWMAILI